MRQITLIIALLSSKFIFAQNPLHIPPALTAPLLT